MTSHKRILRPGTGRANAIAADTEAALRPACNAMNDALQLLVRPAKLAALLRCALELPGRRWLGRRAYTQRSFELPEQNRARMPEVLAKMLLAYLLGNIMGGQIVGWMRGGVDLRRLGSGNVGATNALRTQGAGFALAVLAIDVLKGVVAALALPAIPFPNPFPNPFPSPFPSMSLPRSWIGYCCGVGVALGHCYPATLGFRGGKGVATLAGVFGALVWPALPMMLAVFVLIVLLSGYVSLATIGATVMALFYAACIDARGLWSALGAFTLAMCALVVFKHRKNLLRLWRGEEHRFEQARLLGRLLERRR